MKKFLFLFIFSSNSLHAQNMFDKYYTYDTWTRAFNILEIPPYGYYAIAYNDSLILDSTHTFHTYVNSLILHIDYTGDSLNSFIIGNEDTLYSHLFGRNSDDFFRDGLVSDDGNIVIAGETQSYNPQNYYDYDLWLLKLNPGLDTIWTRTFSLPDSQITLSFGTVIETMYGYFAIAGAQSSFTNGYYQSHITVFDSSGNLKFHSRLLPQLLSYLEGIVQTSDKGFLCSGYLINNINNNNLSPLIIKTDSIGNVQWYYTLPYAGDYHYAENIIKTNDSNYVYVWENVETFGNKKLWHYHATKINEQGVQVWRKDYGYSFDGHQYITELPNGNLMFTGWYSDTLGGNQSGYMLLTDSNGDSLWTRLFHGDPSGPIKCMKGRLTSDGGFILCGETYCCNMNPNLGHTSSLWIAKTDSLGLILNSGEIEKSNFSTSLIGAPYPNPSRYKITVSTLIPMKENYSNCSLLLFDIYSRQLKNIPLLQGLNNTVIDISSLEVGEYIIALSIKGYNCGIRKFIKE